MKKYYILGLWAIGMMTSCQNNADGLDELTSQSKVEVTASLDLTPNSRTALQADGDDYKVVWSEGDAFSVFYGSPDAKSKFELETGEGETTAIFESSNFKVSSGIESGPNGFAVVAYYPYSDATTVSKDGANYILNAEIPVNQSFIDNSFAQNASPMVAVTEGSLTFSFKNVASAFRVPLLGDKTIVKATLTASNKIAGPAKITAVSTDNWIPEVSIEDTKGSSTIVLSCGEGVELNSAEATNFIFVLKPGTYPAGMVVKFYASDGSYYSYTTQGEKTFTRSIVTYINAKTYGTTGTGHDNGTAGIADANDALKAGVQNVDVTIATTDEDPTLKLPASTSENPTNINFETIPSGTTVTITASTESNNQEAKNVNLSVPASQEGYDFEINLPNSTVTLDANGESATYDDVTASTAEETLIISKNVTVNTLKIKKGHVRVHGKISTISRLDNSDDVTYIIKEEGAEIPDNLDEEFEIVSAAEYDLKKAIAEGGSYTLTSDVLNISELLKVEKDLSLDLGGYTLAFTPQTGYPGIKNTANLEIKNGKITSTQIGIQNNGTLTINCDIESVENAINNVYDGETTINGGSFKNTSDNKALIYSDNYGEGTPVLNINGGNFESVFTNISYNNGSTGAVKAGTFKCTGGWHNIYVGGSEGGCNVTYDAKECSFESNGINIQVNNWNVETNKNTLNNTEYTGVHNIQYVSDFADLKSAITAGTSVVLTANISDVSELLKVEKDLSLDLGGYTLAFTPQTGYPGIKNTANLEIKNGKITSTQIGIQNNGTLTIDCDIESVENAINNVYDGETTINGGSFKNTSDNKALIYSDNYGEGTPVLNINGGNFESVFTNVSYNNGSTGAVKAGTFKCTGGWHNIYVGGSEGECNVTYDAEKCSFESNGINIQVNDWGEGKTNTVNGTAYSSTTTLME